MREARLGWPRLRASALLADQRAGVTVVVAGLELGQNLDELADAAFRQRPAGIHQRLVIVDPGLGLGQLLGGRTGSDDLGDQGIIDLADGPDHILAGDARHGYAPNGSEGSPMRSTWGASRGSAAQTKRFRSALTGLSPASDRHRRCGPRNH